MQHTQQIVFELPDNVPAPKFKLFDRVTHPSGTTGVITSMEYVDHMTDAAIGLPMDDPGEGWWYIVNSYHGAARLHRGVHDVIHEDRLVNAAERQLVAA